MRVLIQRVIGASVHIEGKMHVSIGRGILVFAGFEPEDGEEDLDWICQKLCQLRIFDDDKGLMNLSLEDVKGEMLIVSQFTLHASVKKGNRPSYIRAAKAEKAIPLYQKFTKKCA